MQKALFSHGLLSAILRSLRLVEGARPRLSYYIGLIFNHFSKIIKVIHNMQFAIEISPRTGRGWCHEGRNQGWEMPAQGSDVT